jgi:enoyl-CoA hydratase/carnithine racemase
LPADGFHDEVRGFAVELAKGPPLVYRNIKRAVYGSLHGTLDEGLTREVDGQIECIGSTDFVEGISAFLQKRAPAFKGE